MAERPILFSAPMVRAILAGTKTQTRRALRDQNPIDLGACTHGAHLSRRPVLDHGKLVGHRMVAIHCPYGEPGDRLWVRETWREDSPDDPERAIYRADEPSSLPPGFKWKPSIFMPRWASRITLEVKAVRVERLQEISEADAIAEGVPSSVNLQGGRFANENFAHLWRDINGDGSWGANPWVWCISFSKLIT